MRTLGFDLGTVRIGIAVSDELGITAFPQEAIRNTGEQLVHDLADVVRGHQAGRAVIGLPVRLDGTEAAECAEARRVAAALAAETGIEVALWDERLTTRIAERILIESGMRRRKRKTRIDSVAAAVLLQGFLDARRPAGPEGAHGP